MNADVSGRGSESDREMPGLGRACVAALLAGLAIGVVGAGFRAGLFWLAPRYEAFIAWAHAWPWAGWVAPVLLGAVGAGLARLLVRPQPLAGGSGVQHVEAIMRGQAEPAPIWVVPIKFVGGLIGIGTGLALGREGPTIQMGSTIGAALAARFRCSGEIIRDMQAALGGAGLAVAFNAPIGGAMFVFEEVAHAFRLRLTILTIVGTTAAIAVARALLGGAPDFRVVALEAPDFHAVPACFIFGLLLGLLGVVYNRVIIGCIESLERLKGWPVEARAGLVGGIVGAVGWYSPRFVGGGDELSQTILNGGLPVFPLLTILVVRWFVGPLSYSAGTPGGIFSPLLLVGAALGAIFASCANGLLPAGHGVSAIAFSVVGMSAFFTAVVRAPFTGFVLIAEMTATPNLMLPMLAAGAGAMLVASLMRGEPIYDTLRHRMLAGPLYARASAQKSFPK